MKTIVSLLFILMVSISVFGQSNTPIKVKVSVASPDTALKNKLYQSLVDELSLINDIKIQDNLYTFELEVVAMEIKTSKGVFIGYALSTTIAIGFLCKDFLSEEDTYKPSYRQIAHTITLTDKILFKSSVKEIATYFNSKLDGTRKTSRSIIITPR